MNLVLDTPAIHDSQIAGETARLRAELENLITNANRSAFDIAEAAYKVKSSGDYGGYTTFKEYTKTLNMKPQRVRYLTRIAEVMDRLSIPRTEYEPVGIAKLREITSLELGTSWKNPETEEEIPIDDFIRGFIERAHEMPLDNIKQHVRTLKGFTGENDLVYETICMTRSAMENNWKPAIALAKMHIGSIGKDDEGVSKDASNGSAAEKLAIAYLIDPANGTLFEQLVEEEETENLVA